jgi:hypothetical protein
MSCQVSQAWTGNCSVPPPPRAWSPLPTCKCLAPSISMPTTLDVPPRTPSLSSKPQIIGDRRRERAPPPAKPPELWPPWPSHPSHPQSTISARIASPETREAPKPSDPAEPHRRNQIASSDFFCSPIELSRREHAGILTVDELPRLRTWTSRLRPPLTLTRTLT